MSAFTQALKSAKQQVHEEFVTALTVQRERLFEHLESANVSLNKSANLATLLRVVRVLGNSEPNFRVALGDFQVSMADPFRNYVAFNDWKDRPLWQPETEALWDYYTDRDWRVAPNWVSRVVICAKHTYRAWRRIRREHRNSRATDGISR